MSIRVVTSHGRAPRATVGAPTRKGAPLGLSGHASQDRGHVRLNIVSITATDGSTCSWGCEEQVRSPSRKDQSKEHKDGEGGSPDSALERHRSGFRLLAPPGGFRTFIYRVDSHARQAERTLAGPRGFDHSGLVGLCRNHPPEA